MKLDEVPQDNAKTLAGQRKAMYAVDENGHYSVTQSSGWDVEEIVLNQAIEQYQQLAEQAFERVEKGQTSVLEVHMYQQRMDITLLAQSTGFFKWQVKRHLKPAIFAKLSEAKLSRYADVLGLELKTLQQLPAKGSQ